MNQIPHLFWSIECENLTVVQFLFKKENQCMMEIPTSYGAMNRFVPLEVDTRTRNLLKWPDALKLRWFNQTGSWIILIQCEISFSGLFNFAEISFITVEVFAAPQMLLTHLRISNNDHVKGYFWIFFFIPLCRHFKCRTFTFNEVFFFSSHIL